MKNHTRCRLHTLVALAASCCALSARATITNIVCNPADYTCQQTTNVNNSIVSATDAIGFAGGTPSWTAILMFPLPTLPAGKVIGNQTTFNVTLSSVGASTTFNGDLWGVANYRADLPTGTPNATFYYYLANDTGPGANSTPTDTKLLNNFLTPSLIGSPGGTIVSTVAGSPNSLQAYIQQFYSNNPAYDASIATAYVWLRINPDGPSGSTANRYVINAGDTGVSASLRPTLHLDITDPPTSVPLVWNGNASAVWDINNAPNWKQNATTGLIYQDNSDVIFDDTLAGNSSVVLNATVAPSSVTVNNNATNYSIAGTGKITGTNSLVKLGTKTLILDTDNDYSGGTTLAGGTLQVGNGDGRGSYGSGPLSVSGQSSIVFNRTNALTVNTIANGGAIPSVTVNSGSVTFAGATDNNATAATVNSGGTLILGKPSSGAVHALGTSSTIKPGGTIQLGGTGGDQIYQGVIITNNGVFDLAGNDEGFNGMTGSGVVTNSGAVNSTLAFGDGGGSASFAGKIVDGASGAVAVLKRGNGTQILTGASTYTGDTTVTAGKLVVGAAAIGGANYTVTDAATLGVSITSSNATLNVASLEIGNAALEFQNVGSTNIAPLHAATLTLDGSVAINVASGNFIPGESYPLVAYSALGGGGNLYLGTLPPGVFATLDTSSSPIKLVVTSVALTWNGNNSAVWDINGALNWKAAGVINLPYPDGEIVTLDDTLAGNPAIDLEAVVSPLAFIASNNVTAYSISGPGYISGPALLLKTGTNTLILDTDNDYYGGTVLAGGTLQIGNNDAHGSIGSGTFTNLVAGSILAFNRTDAITLNNTITRTTVDNSAALVINSGSVTLAGNGDNSGAGATVNSGATLVLGKFSSANVHALSSANLVVNPGGVLQLAGTGNDQIYTSSGLTDNGIFDLAGYNEGFDRLAGSGVVTNSAGGVSTLQLGEQGGSATFAGRVLDGTGSLALTKTGAGTVTLTGASTYTGDTVVNAGKLVATTASTGGGSYATANNAALGVSVATANGSLNVSSLTLGASSASTLEFQNLNSTSVAAITAGAVAINGTVTVNITSGTFAAGQNYPLLAYSSVSGGGGYTLGTLPGGMVATLNTASSPVTLHVSSVVNRTPTNIVTSVSNGVLTMLWPADHTGWLLQSNAVGVANSGAWQPVPGSTTTNSVSITISTNTPQVYFRLVN
jgi:autotransporter-associated beta strand protein